MNRSVEVTIAMASPLSSTARAVPFLNSSAEVRWLKWRSASVGRSGASIIAAEMDEWSGIVPPSREVVLHVLLPGEKPASATRDLGDGRRDTLTRPGQICVTPAAQPGHWAWRGRFRDLNLVIPGKLLARIADDAGLAKVPDLMPLARSPQEDLFVASLIQRLGWLSCGKKGLSLAAESDHAIALIGCWLLNKTKPGLIMPKGGLAPSVTRRVQNYIEDHLGEDLTVGELADLAGLSTPYFSHAFRRSVGEAPHRYVLKRRCARACTLLEQRKGLSDIASAVGFANQSHFTTVFRRVIGTTPAAWRRTRRG